MEIRLIGSTDEIAELLVKLQERNKTIKITTALDPEQVCKAMVRAKERGAKYA